MRVQKSDPTVYAVDSQSSVHGRLPLISRLRTKPIVEDRVGDGDGDGDGDGCRDNVYNGEESQSSSSNNPTIRTSKAL